MANNDSCTDKNSGDILEDVSQDYIELGYPNYECINASQAKTYMSRFRQTISHCPPAIQFKPSLSKAGFYIYTLLWVSLVGENTRDNLDRFIVKIFNTFGSIIFGILEFSAPPGYTIIINTLGLFTNINCSSCYNGPCHDHSIQIRKLSQILNGNLPNIDLRIKKSRETSYKHKEIGIMSELNECSKSFYDNLKLSTKNNDQQVKTLIQIPQMDELSCIYIIAKRTDNTYVTYEPIHDISSLEIFTKYSLKHDGYIARQDILDAKIKGGLHGYYFDSKDDKKESVITLVDPVHQKSIIYRDDTLDKQSEKDITFYNEIKEVLPDTIKDILDDSVNDFVASKKVIHSKLDDEETVKPKNKSVKFDDLVTRNLAFTNEYVTPTSDVNSFKWLGQLKDEYKEQMLENEKFYDAVEIDVKKSVKELKSKNIKPRLSTTDEFISMVNKDLSESERLTLISRLLDDK